MFGSVSKESGGYSTVEMGQDSTVKGGRDSTSYHVGMVQG